MTQRSFPQLMSLLSPAPPLLPGALPPDRRATLQPARGWLRAAPPLGKGEPFPKPLPPSNLNASTSTSTRLSEFLSRVKSRPARQSRLLGLSGVGCPGCKGVVTTLRAAGPSSIRHEPHVAFSSREARWQFEFIVRSRRARLRRSMSRRIPAISGSKLAVPSCTDHLRSAAPRRKSRLRRGLCWWRRRGSNPRPSHCERDALPTELRPRSPPAGGPAAGQRS
jgi:hypothetical protein